MSYKKPAVTVIQEFQSQQPTVAAFNLPVVAVGPAYQLVDNDLLGTFSGAEREYPYASLMGGAKVDLEVLADDEVYKVTKKPVTVSIKNAEVEILAGSQTGAFDGIVLKDGTRFSKVLPGDVVVISEKKNITIVEQRADGQSSSDVNKKNRLVGSFESVKIGDKVIVTGGSNTIPGEYVVISKPTDALIVLNGNINDGADNSTNVGYSIVGDRGTKNKGNYIVRSMNTDGSINLTSHVVEKETMVYFEIRRKIAEVALTRDATSGFSVTSENIKIAGDIKTVDNFRIVGGKVYASYRAMRNDLSGKTYAMTGTSGVAAFFGESQIHPANPLAFAAQKLCENTTTEINVLGIDNDVDESIAYGYAADVLKRTNMYAIVLLTQSPVVHGNYKAHVVEMSDPLVKKSRVVIFNRKLVTETSLQGETTTIDSIDTDRVIVNTNVDGILSAQNLDQLSDTTPDQFLNVQLGDTVIVTGGTNAAIGNYTVKAKMSNNSIKLDRSAGNGDCSDLQYYIVRKDGISADGKKLYDSKATFVESGVTPGCFLKMGTKLVKITNVISNKEIEFTQLPGITSLVPSITYSIVNVLTRKEQAEVIAGYSRSFASRRCVHVWPDILLAPVGPSTERLPGFYAGCAIGAMTSGLPTQQGFTNLGISGFTGLEHSSVYFEDSHLDIIADGGTMIIAQDTPGAQLYCRHQLTTDRSTIKFQEYSVTKNVDFAEKYLYSAYGAYIGKFNIIDTTLDTLKTVAKSVITFLKDKTKREGIGGVIKNGVLKECAENPDQIDSVKMRFGLDFPIPLNDLEITMEV